jgi:glycosidase
MVRATLATALAALLALDGGAAAQGPDPAARAAAAMRARAPQAEIIYFLLPDRFANGDPRNDRGGIPGGKLDHGFDPSDKAFYQGGDLKGLTGKLDYIAGLGSTAIWLGPVYRNKAVQPHQGGHSAGYHGYWITDFLDVDPHFGAKADLKALIAAAHARGMKVYLDIITNHTADVIEYRGCAFQACAYRSQADFPWTRAGGPAGAAINGGFTGVDDRSPANFARLTNPTWAYQPVVPEAERTVKNPAWLNDPIHYNNRGVSDFRGEASVMGDFPAGLDDLNTAHPRVVAGLIDIFGWWIDEYGVDGFRIDTARHVEPEFWQVFVPAMLERARARGIPNFHIFGEVFDPDPAALARHTRVDGFPAVLDFAFQAAVTDVIAKGQGTTRLATLFAADHLYEGGAPAARQLPTFLGNHDMGRFAHFVRQARPYADDAEVLARVRLAHALMFFARGVPTVYSGDEQGFAGDGGDQDARETHFASRVPSYLDNRLLGTASTHARDNYDAGHPLYRAIAQFAAIRRADPALSDGAMKIRAHGENSPLFAFSRLLPDGSETLVAINAGVQAVSANVLVEADSARFRPSLGDCAPAAQAPGSYRVSVPALSAVVCRAVR